MRKKTETAKAVDIPRINRAKAVETHLSHSEQKISLLETQIKHGELSEDQIMGILIRIENTRLSAVDEIWQVVKDIMKKIKDEVKLGKADMGKLAVVLGILVNNAQLISGGPTQRVAFSSGKPKMTSAQRMTAYKTLAMGKKPGRPQGGEKE